MSASKIPYGHSHHSDMFQTEEGGAFVLERIGLILAITPSGELAGVEAVQGLRRQQGSDMLVPARLPGIAGGLLWGAPSSALGVRRIVTSAGIDGAAFDKFRTLQESLLEDVADIGLQAFLKFIRRWQPLDALEHPTLTTRLGFNVAFRFRYDDECLHQKSAARSIWKAHVAQVHGR